MPRPLWSGSLTFGLVTIPVRVVTAVASHRARFRLLHDADNAPLERRMLCPAHNRYIDPKHILRGYPVDEERYVAVDEGEIESLEPKRSGVIEIRHFTGIGAIDPVYYDRPYYLIPAGAEKPYHMLVHVLQSRGKMGIAEFVMNRRQHLAGVGGVDGALCLFLLHYPSEIRDAQDVAPPPATVSAKDTQPVRQAISRLSGQFDPRRYEDNYQKRIEELIHNRREQMGTVELPGTAVEEEQQVEEETDLISILEQSLRKSKRKA